MSLEYEPSSKPPHGTTAKQNGNDLKRFENLYLNTKARIWPPLSYMCHICSPAVVPLQLSPGQPSIDLRGFACPCLLELVCCFIPILISRPQTLLIHVPNSTTSQNFRLKSILLESGHFRIEDAQGAFELNTPPSSFSKVD